MIGQNLAGLRVVEVADYVAGPACGRLLAASGARVVKVEPPNGDTSRGVGPFHKGVSHPEGSALFLYLNGGKEGVRLDYAAPEGKQVLMDLLEWADVLVLGLSPVECDRLGLSPASLAKRFGRLIVAALSSFGQSGPYRDFAATDLIISAVSGCQYESGEPDREPLKYYGNQPSNLAGVHASIGVVAALIRRAFTGQGTIVDSSALRASMIVSEARVTERALTGTNVARTGRSVKVFPPPLYPCADGYVSMLATDDQWPRLCAMAELTQLGSEPRFASAPARTEHYEELDLNFQPWFLSHTKAELFELGRQYQVPIAPVNSPEEILRDRHFVERGYLETAKHEHHGSYSTPGLFFREVGNSSPAGSLRAAPLLGQDTVRVLQSDLGYQDGKVHFLRSAGVI